jgi:hypothetical protein
MTTSFSILDLIIGGVLGFAVTGLAAGAYGIARCLAPPTKRSDEVQVTVSGAERASVRSVALTFFNTPEE